MKKKRILFLYYWPHHVHKSWGEAVSTSSFRSRGIHLPVLKEISVFLKFPFLPDADVYLCESGFDLPLAALKKIFNRKIKIIYISATPLLTDYYHGLLDRITKILIR